MALFGYRPEDPQPGEERLRGWEALKREMPGQTWGGLALLTGLNMLANNRGQNIGSQIGSAALGTLGAWEGYQAMKRQEAEKAAELEREQARQAIEDERWERKFTREGEVSDRDYALQVARFNADQQERKAAAARAWAGISANRAAQQRAAEEAANFREINGVVWERDPQTNTWDISRTRNVFDKDGNIVTAAEKPRTDGKLVTGQSGEVGFAYPDGSFVPVQMPEGFNALPAGATPQYVPQDAASRKELASLIQQDQAIKSLEEELDNAPDSATGLIVGSMPNSVATRMDPKGVPLRAAIANFSSQIMNALSGAAVSEQEKVRLEGFLPTSYDSLETIRSKMDQYRAYLRSKASAWEKTYGQSPVLGRSSIYGGQRGQDAQPPTAQHTPAAQDPPAGTGGKGKSDDDLRALLFGGGKKPQGQKQPAARKPFVSGRDR